MNFGNVTLALFICYSAQFINAQSEPAGNTISQSSHATNSESDLKMTIIGNGKLRSGHDMAIRKYGAPDGTEGEVTYATLPSVQGARNQIREWVKLAQTISNREQGQKKQSKFISERILGSRELVPRDPTKTPKATEFLIIRRDGVNCYFIESLSLATAMKIEDLIQ